MESDPVKKKLKVRSIISHEENATKIEIPRQVLKVVLQADGEVSHGDVLKAAQAIGEVGNVQLHIGVQEPE